MGRSAERAALPAAYARAAAGEPRVVLITGAAGIGKTRLAEDLSQQAGQAGAQVLAGESAPLAGAALAYGPFLPQSLLLYVSSAAGPTHADPGYILARGYQVDALEQESSLR